MPFARTGRARCPRSAVMIGRSTIVLLITLTIHSSLFSADSLADKSPFLPPGHGEKAAEPVAPVQQQGPISREIEFRGIIQLGGTYQFSIFNKKDQKGYWLKENVSQNGISVRGYDAASSTVVVNMNGRSERLTMMSATDNPLPVAQAKPTPPTPPKNNVRAPIVPPNLNNQNQEANSQRVIPRRRVVLPRKVPVE